MSLKNNKTYTIVFSLILLISIFLSSYFNRWIFVYHFDPVYWENAYYESQWNVANSSRQISDEAVYRYIGYRLVNNGENPFNVDYWVPPLGKYTYGLSAKFLNNPYITSYIYYLGSVLIFYLISKRLFKTPLHLISTILFSCNPLIVEQIQQTMLDLPLTFFFLLFVYFFIFFLQTNNKKYLYFSSISLGLTAGIKPQFFIPTFTIISLFFLVKNKQVKKIPIFILFIIVGYILSYFCYWIKHPNPIPWIRLHQKIIDFQKNNGGSHDILNIFRFVFTREYRGFWVNAKSYWPANWSTILPIGFISSILIFLKKFKKNKLPDWVLFLSLIIIFYFAMNLMIDFWPRYLVPMVPLLILVIIYLLKKNYFLLTLIFLSYIPMLYLSFFPKSTEFKNSFQNLYQKNFYKDTYQQLDTQSKNKFSIDQWKSFSEHEEFTNKKFQAIKENNQWRININSY